MNIRLTKPKGTPGFILVAVGPDEKPTGLTLLVQTDWDYPALASDFGWNIREVQFDGTTGCDHSGSDGTVRCPNCSLTADAFIESARNFLLDSIGNIAPDPGYFTER
jgi:hypothetical protein